MLRNFFVVALRQLARNKIYSLINILGFAIGLAVTILISIYVIDDYSYDRFHEKRDRIYRLLTFDATETIGGLGYAITAGPLVAAINENIPEVEAAARATSFGRVGMRRVDENLPDDAGFDITGRVLVTDPEFLEIFSYDLIQGNPETALTANDEILLGEELAHALFGDDDPMGQQVTTPFGITARVTGIIETPPLNSHRQFDCIIKLNPEQNPVWWDSWENLMLNGYILLAEDADPQVAEEKIIRLAHDNGFADVFTPGLQPLLDVHLGSSDLKYDANFGKNDIKNVYAMTVIAIMVMLIASFNFINLTSARAPKRAREVGMRKVVGAGKHQLLLQFLGESILTTLVAMCIALVIAQLLLPFLEDFLNKQLDFSFLDYPWLIISLVLGSALVGFIAGLYPSMVLSGFSPIKVLKGQFKSTSQGILLRRILVVGQFAVSIALIVGVMIVLGQIRYLQTVNMGYNRDQVVIFPTFNRELGEHRDVLMEQLRTLPAVESVGSSWQLPGSGNDLIRIEVVPQDAPDPEVGMMFDQFYADQYFLETMGIEVKYGRNFSLDFGSDSASAIIINEKAMQEFGWEELQNQQLSVVEASEETTHWNVVGVINNVHFSNLRQATAPTLMRFATQPCGFVLARLRAGQIIEGIDQIEAVWNEIYPEQPYSPLFYDEFFQFQFANDRNFATKIAVFSGLAIFIACLGLFGLTSFSTEQRRKEIAVRKVLGSSEARVVFLLTGEFLKWVAISNLIAWPLCWFTMKMWLDDFTYRAPWSPVPFLTAGAAALLIAAITVSFQTIRASRTNPVEAIRTE